MAAPAAFLQLGGPGYGLAVGAWGVPSLVGRGRAIDLCLSMRAVAADEALAIGLVDRVADDADAAALELAAGLAALDPAAAARVKRVAWSATSALKPSTPSAPQPRGMDGSMTRGGREWLTSTAACSSSMRRMEATRV